MSDFIDRHGDDFWSWSRAWLRLLAMAFGIAFAAAIATPPTPESLVTITGIGTSVSNGGKGYLDVVVRLDEGNNWRGRLHRTWAVGGFSRSFIGQSVKLQVGRDPVFGRESIFGAKGSGRTLVDLDESLADQWNTYRLLTVLSIMVALAGFAVGWLTWNYPSLRTTTSRP